MKHKTQMMEKLSLLVENRQSSTTRIQGQEHTILVQKKLKILLGLMLLVLRREQHNLELKAKMILMLGQECMKHKIQMMEKHILSEESRKSNIIKTQDQAHMTLVQRESKIRLGRML